MEIKSHCQHYPASSIQEQFWLTSRLQPQSTAYNIPSLFHINGPLNTDFLVMSLKEIVKRHDVFRTVFSTEEGRLQQIVSEKAELQFTLISLGNIGLEDKEKKIQELISEEVRVPFDLEKGPLLRTKLIYINDNEYYLLILSHHIITDLRTKDLLSSEVSHLYNTFINGESSCLDEPEQQYKDYSIWQRDWSNSRECEKMNSYWLSELSDHSGYLNFPTDYARQPVQAVSGGNIPITLSPRFTASLQDFSKANSVNIYLTLLTAYLVLLYRYTGQNDIIIGVPLTNRRQESFKNIFGCFVNIVPLALNVSGEMIFSDVLRQVRRQMLLAHRNQEVPYEHIVKKLQPKRDPSYNPIFQVGYTFAHPMELGLDNLDVNALNIHNNGSQLDLFLTLWEKDGEVNGFFEYNAELFARSTVEHISDNYETLLHGILKKQDDPISTLPLLSESEKYKVTEEWNNTDLDLPEDFLLQSAFEQQVKNNPDAIALAFKESNLTYHELNTRANQLAHQLQLLGVEADTFVGVYMDRSLEMVIALLGIIKAGGAYLPLDPSFPEDRIAYMLDDSNASVLLTQEDLAQHIKGANVELIFVDKECSGFKHHPTTKPSLSLQPDNLAYVMYTSGSTGKPKGVQISHIAVVNFLLSMSKEPGMVSSDVLLAVTTLSFDISVLELFLPLSIGAKTVIASWEDAINGQRLLRLIDASGSTIMQATPTTWYLLLSAGWEGSEDFKVLCGGEPMPQDLALQLVERSQNVWNLYGPTETTIWSSVFKVTQGNTAVLVGRPIANTQLYIVNEEDQPNPIGVSGELLIGGIGLSRGYLNRPELTDEKFIPDHLGRVPDGRLYRTGDLACYLPDGNIKLYGRIDNQVKLRGFRIELGEIEATIEPYPGVDQSVVVIREETNGNKRLVAYLTLGKNADFSEFELRQHLRQNLPDYMVPSIFVILEEMPLTPNKKIDRKSLPEPDLKRPELEEKLVLPRNEFEKKVAHLWAAVLKIDTVGTHDNFFDLGGDSLLCVQLVTLLEKELKKDIPVVKFFQYPTIKAFTEYIEKSDTQQNALFSSVQNRSHLQRKALKQRQRMSRRS